MLSQIYLLFTILIIITAVFGYFNERFFKLPPAIGIMFMSMLISIAILTIGKSFPDFKQKAINGIAAVDFHTLLLKIMLGFLLFASAFHINVRRLQREIIPIVTFASIGVVISTFIIGILSYWMLSFFYKDVHLVHCLLFGALISPTDPIAVMGVIKKIDLPKSLKAKISGESLFNDGIGVLLFVILKEVADPGIENPTIGKMIWIFIQETGGGILWGAILGYSSLHLHRKIDNYKVEVLITLAVVMGGYTFADYIHVSGPLCMVMAGIILGEQGVDNMSDITSDYVGKFWELIDEILNALLFLLIGFEMLVIPFNYRSVIVGSLSVVIVLLARFLSVSIPVFFLSFRQAFEKNSITFLTWGGIRGGISVALALSLPAEMYRNRIVTITYFVVVFSIIVQGLTIKKIAQKLSESSEEEISKKQAAAG